MISTAVGGVVCQRFINGNRYEAVGQPLRSWRTVVARNRVAQRGAAPRTPRLRSTRSRDEACASASLGDQLPALGHLPGGTTAFGVRSGYGGGPRETVGNNRRDLRSPGHVRLAPPSDSRATRPNLGEPRPLVRLRRRHLSSALPPWDGRLAAVYTSNLASVGCCIVRLDLCLGPSLEVAAEVTPRSLLPLRLAFRLHGTPQLASESVHRIGSSPIAGS
jgi:hypothetical protein